MKFEKKRKIQILCIAAGAFFFLIYPMAGASDFLKPGGVIERNTYGQGDKEGILIVEGLLDGKEEIEIQIKERQYSKKEADNKFEQAFQEVQKEALADNPSFDKVSSSLKLSSRLDSFGMTMKWESQNPELIDPEGEVYLEQMQKEQEKTVLFLTLKAGNYQRKYEIPVTVVKPVLTKQEKSLKLLADTIESADEKQKYEEKLILPAKLEGREIRYSEKHSCDRYIFLLLGAAAAVLMEYRESSQEREEKKKRNTELALDYSDIVSGLCVYLGAGFPVRKAWEQLAKEYEMSLKLPGGRKRAGYEEIRISVGRMNQGMSELRAYGEFGKSCGLRSYRKLAGLMTQYVKNGSGSLRKNLEEEMENAFEERKAAARKIGEETGTKLLIPLFMMLLIVMVMVSVPAFLAFGI